MTDTKPSQAGEAEVLAHIRARSDERVNTVMASNDRRELLRMYDALLARAMEAEALSKQSAADFVKYGNEWSMALESEKRLAASYLNSLQITAARFAKTECELSAAQAALREKQSRIDALMFEYCPDDMTCQQRAEWVRHQGRVSESDRAAIDAALPPSQPAAEAGEG